jgi:hypothetical protein
MGSISEMCASNIPETTDSVQHNLLTAYAKKIVCLLVLYTFFTISTTFLMKVEDLFGETLENMHEV